MRLLLFTFSMVAAHSFGQSTFLKLGTASTIPIRPLPALTVEQAVTNRLSFEFGYALLPSKGATTATYFLDNIAWLSGKYFLALNRRRDATGIFVAPILLLEQSRWIIRQPRSRLSSDYLIDAGVAAGIQLPLHERIAFQAQAGIVRQFIGLRKLFDQDNHVSSTARLSTDFNLFFNISIGYRIFNK